MEVRKHREAESDLGPGYSHELYEFEEAGMILRVRSYTAEPFEAHFLGMVGGSGRSVFLTPADFGTEFVRAALAYLRADGKKSFTFLSEEAGGYVAVPE